MGRKRNKNRQRDSTPQSKVAYLLTDGAYDDLCVPGYTTLDKNPEIMTACRKIASLIGVTTIHLMANTEKGDERIVNELSRKIDIDPMPNMTRQTWVEGIVQTMLISGRGNAIVMPHTSGGLLDRLEPISASRVTLYPVGYQEYQVMIDGVPHDPGSVLHFVNNPDPLYPWKGRGPTVVLRDVANNLKQAAATEKGFMESKWKPSVIVKIDASTEEFSSPAGRKKILHDYIESEEVGTPWLIPADQFQVEQVKPLSLADLAIKDTVELDKRLVAAVLGVPSFVVGVGSYNKDEWNCFIQSTIMPLAKGIAAELTKKLILSPKWYWRFNVWSLMDYDLKAVSDVLLQGSDRGFVNGDEWRDRVHLPPAGLTEYRVLENYIPGDMSGQQKKLVQKEE